MFLLGLSGVKLPDINHGVATDLSTSSTINGIPGSMSHPQGCTSTVYVLDAGLLPSGSTPTTATTTTTNNTTATNSTATQPQFYRSISQMSRKIL